jgi:para-aminobenzoate synthetase / 4-amino-4-deoxychorismate lyase
MLVLDGVPIELDAHEQRLERSTRELFAAEPPAGTHELVLERAQPLELGRVRVTVRPDAAGLGAEARTASVDPADVFPSADRGADLHVLVIRGGLGAHKWADRSALAAAEQDAPGAVPLLVDVEVEVLEASRANVFAVGADVLVTPPDDGRILPGVTRARAIEVAHALGVGVEEEALSLERLLSAGEAFLTGSVRGIEPVRSIDGTELRRPGELTSRIAAELKRIWMDGARHGARSSREARPLHRA